MVEAATGAFQLTIDVASDRLASFPVEGVVDVLGQRIGFTRRRTSQILNLTAADGLPFTVPAGTLVLVIDATPRPPGGGAVIYRNEQKGGCAIGDGTADSLLPLFLGLPVLAFGRRRRI
jgi:hypothetical protein